MIVAGFDWDQGNKEKCRKHGVPIAEIEALFAGTPRVAPDPAHSRNEERFVAVGRNQHGRAMFVAFTLRGTGPNRLIRPISARYMHAKESTAYDQQYPQNDIRRGG